MSKVIRVGINGMGRIGRTVLREIAQRNDSEMQIVAVNNPGKPERYVHLLKYDSTQGTFPLPVEYSEGHLKIDGKLISFFTKSDPSEIPWSNQEVDIVIDATGIFKDKEALGRHLKGSVKKVIMCAPGKDLDGTFVVGINHEAYDQKTHHVISNASCTTNCLAPIAKVIHESFGISSGFMTTVHAYTSDQKLLDGAHNDFRRARSAALSMIPTTTGAAKAVGVVIPELQGKLDGYAVRVPTPNVSLVDLTVVLEKKTTIKEVNLAMKEASEGRLKGILGYTEEPLVSIDYVGMKESSQFDATITSLIDKTLKVVAWYDNEAGFSNRVIDLASFIGSKL
ncbi:MAG: type I glyceraldehyde-3-phosphate dehydrogenase [Bdellovibrionota bacterium]|nr:type I glyceraldehyde-3-phosphate dehydrogenase [Bdellovibrionota bacterium]